MSVVYSPCGTKIASASADKTLRIWNAQTGQCVSTLSGHSKWYVTAVSYSCLLKKKNLPDLSAGTQIGEIKKKNSNFLTLPELLRVLTNLIANAVSTPSPGAQTQQF